MEKVFVAQRVLNKLITTESAVDGALVEASELMSELIKARKDVGASISLADDAQAKLLETIRALSEARTTMVAVHGELMEAKLRLGIRTRLDGQETGPHLQETTQTTLRSVG